MTEQACGSNLRSCAVWIYCMGTSFCFVWKYDCTVMTKGEWDWWTMLKKKLLSAIAHHLLARGHEIAGPTETACKYSWTWTKGCKYVDDESTTHLPLSLIIQSRLHQQNLHVCAG
jgi:hypothetical protein